MKRDEWLVLQKFLARPGRGVPVEDLMTVARSQSGLQGTISRLRRTLADAGLEIRTDGRTRGPCTWYALIDLRQPQEPPHAPPQPF